MLICLILAAIVFAVTTIWASVKEKECPDSISSYSYYIGFTEFSLWSIATAALLMAPLMSVLFSYNNYSWVAGVCTLFGLLMVGISPKYRTETKVIHYGGGYLCGIASQVVVGFLFPWLLSAWSIFVAFFLLAHFYPKCKGWKENATFVSEVICFSTLFISLFIKII